MPTFKINGKPVTRQEWDARRPNGRLKEICDSGRMPGLRTDTLFFAGSHNDPNVSEEGYNLARAAGVQTEGRKHFDSLGAPEDPDTWHNSFAGVKRAAEKKNLSLFRADECVVKARQVEPEPEGPYEVAEDLVNKYTQYKIDDNPGIAETPQQVAALKEEVRKELTPADAG
jgi:hypothetical protein